MIECIIILFNVFAVSIAEKQRNHVSFDNKNDRLLSILLLSVLFNDFLFFLYVSSTDISLMIQLASKVCCYFVLYERMKRIIWKRV